MNSQTQAIEDHQAEEAAAFEMKRDALNPTGIRPVEYYCLVKLDPVEEKSGSIILPDQRQDRDQMAQTYATLVEIGGNCFEGWNAPLPKVGDRIVINKYAGQTPKAGDFTDLFRLCTDKDIVAIVET